MSNIHYGKLKNNNICAKFNEKLWLIFKSIVKRFHQFDIEQRKRQNELVRGSWYLTITYSISTLTEYYAKIGGYNPTDHVIQLQLTVVASCIVTIDISVRIYYMQGLVSTTQFNGIIQGSEDTIDLLCQTSTIWNRPLPIFGWNLCSYSQGLSLNWPCF